MVREVRIYVEGGGSNERARTKLRRGLNRFLGSLCELARVKRIRWQVIPCGPRNLAFESYREALRIHAAAFNVLLVDSEAPVAKSSWKHLEGRDGWEIPDSSEEQCHLMVHCMESWLLADPAALAEFYGQGFRLKALPRTTDVEAVTKEKVAASLAHATKETQKGRYHKIRHGPDLLGRLDPDRVRQRAKHCERLFVTLESVLRASG
jgi:hypothetical protein